MDYQTSYININRDITNICIDTGLHTYVLHKIRFCLLDMRINYIQQKKKAKQKNSDREILRSAEPRFQIYQELGWERMLGGPNYGLIINPQTRVKKKLGKYKIIILKIPVIHFHSKIITSNIFL